MPRKQTTEDLVAQRPTSEELQSLPRTPISVLVDNVRSLDNVGLLFRLCDLARVEKLYLCGYTGYPALEYDERPKDVVERHVRRIEKTAVYAVSVQPWEYHPDPVPLAQKLKKDGHTLIALEQTDESVPYHKLPVTHYTLPVTLLVGHEREGVRQELLELADHYIDIPILGHGNSHNVATAAGIVLYSMLEKIGRLN